MVATAQDGSNELPPDSLGTVLAGVHAALEGAPLCYGHGTDNAWDEAVQLVLAAAGLRVDAGEEVLGLRLAPAVRERIAAWVDARIIERTPLPYLTGQAWFAGLAFRCDARALVPRSPLAEVILADFAPWWQGAPPRRLLDLCCGGGAIGIAAAVHNPELVVTLADISRDALDLARDNVSDHAVAPRVTLVESDLFGALGDARFDVILCNPPYVDAADLAAMPREYAAEPALGLGSGHDGLDHARYILATAAHHLDHGGLLFLELGNSWEALDRELATLPLTWLEFDNGGHGVLLLRRDELPAVAAALATRAR